MESSCVRRLVQRRKDAGTDSKSTFQGPDGEVTFHSNDKSTLSADGKVLTVVVILKARGARRTRRWSSTNNDQPQRGTNMPVVVIIATFVLWLQPISRDVAPEREAAPLVEPRIVARDLLVVSLPALVSDLKKFRSGP